MSKYIGNHPVSEIVQYSGSRFDYVNTGNPAIDTNPDAIGKTWLNLTTGEEFICVDNTTGSNVWNGTISGYGPDPSIADVAMFFPFDSSITEDLQGTTWEAFATAQLSTAQTRFGRKTALFDGNSDYLQTAGSNLPTIGTGDFTLEWWSYYDSPLPAGADYLSDMTIFGPSNVVSNQHILFFLTYNNGGAQMWNGTAGIGAGTSPVQEWVYWAIERISGVVSIYRNGSLANSGAYATNVAVPTYFRVGGYAYNDQRWMKGYLSDLRLTLSARYNGSVSVPVRPLSRWG